MVRRGRLPKRCLVAVMFILCGVPGSGCSEPPEAVRVTEPPESDVVLEGDVVEVPRGALSEAQSKLRGEVDGVVGNSERTFYLAIRRSELSQRWFWSGMLRHFFPDGAYWGVPHNLRTYVVTMREKNGRLFFMNAKDGLLFGGNEKLDFPLESYPIVTDHAPFNRLPGSEQYVLIDPAAGGDSIGIVGDRWFGGATFRMEMSFAQRFRRASDGGAMFEQVFLGHLSIPEDRSMYREYNDTRWVGTLSLALRKYREGPGYTRTPPPELPYYFLNSGRLVPYSGEVEQEAVKWNIHPGMKPIRWYMTPNLLELKKDPRYRDLDLVGALKRGIEGWNEAFGFPVFEAVLADASVDFGEDDKNFAIFHPVLEPAGAWADLSPNPNTGELRRAHFVFNAGLFRDADLFFSDDPALLSSATPVERPPRPRLSWGGETQERLCELDTSRMGAHGSLAALTDPDRAALASMTKKEKMERHFTHIVVHEVGHTLGLRHNLNGSRTYDGTPATPRSSSVMDHLHELDTIHMVKPGSFDVAAVRYLYGLSSALPTDLFCTSGLRGRALAEPACASLDRFDDPLTRYHTPVMRELMADVLAGAPQSFPFIISRQTVEDYVRGGTAQEQVRGYDLLMEQVRPPLQVPPGQGAAYVARANAMALRILGNFYLLELDPYYSPFPNPPPSTPAYTEALFSDVRGILLNVDGHRPFSLRREMVAVLKAHQTLAAYGLLLELHAELTARLPTLSGEERWGTLELLGRIEAANSPYFR